MSSRLLVGLASYSFASSYKWFLMLVFLLPAQVAAMVPGGEKNAYWGAVFGLGAIWAVVGHAVFGHLSDRSRDRRTYILAGSLLTCAALAVLYNAHVLWLLAAGYLFLGVSDDVSMGPYSALLPELIPKDRRGRASGTISMAMSLSQVVAVVASLAFAGRALPSYVSIALLNVMAAVWVVRAVGKLRTTEVRHPAGSNPTGWLAPWKNPDFRRVWVVCFSANLAFTFVIPYAQFFIRDMIPRLTLFGIDLGGPITATGLLGLTIALSAAFSAFAAGKWIDRIGRKKVTWMGAGLMLTAYLAMIRLPDFNVLWLLAILLGVGQGAFQSANWSMAADVMPDRDSLGRDMGLWQSSMTSVQVIAGSAGLLVTYGNNVSRGLGYQALFLLAALAMLASIAATRNIRAST